MENSGCEDLKTANITTGNHFHKATEGLTGQEWRRQHERNGRGKGSKREEWLKAEK